MTIFLLALLFIREVDKINKKIYKKNKILLFYKIKKNELLIYK